VGSIGIKAALFFAALLGSISTDGGKWKFQTAQDPMDDKGRAVLSLDAENRIEGKFPALIIRCDATKQSKDGWGRKRTVANAAVYVVTNTPVDRGDERHLRVRLDDRPAESDTWVDSDSLHAVFHDTATVKGQVQFVKRIAAAKRMLFEFTPFLGTPQVVEFDVAGLDHYMEQMSSFCGWPK
jgi:hypothetical protein